MTAGPPLSLRAYARSRKERGLTGGTHTAVGKAIASGRLVHSIARAGRRWMIDPALADQEWSDNSDPVKQTEEPAPPARSQGAGLLFPDAEPPAPQVLDPKAAASSAASIKRSQAVRLAYQARLAQLEFEERSGKLCPVADVKLQAARCAGLVKAGLLNLPSRLDSLLAAESERDQVHRLLLLEVETVLGELAETMRGWGGAA